MTIRQYIARFLNRSPVRDIIKTSMPDSDLHAEYISGGSVPWSKGYSKYRNDFIEKVLASSEMVDLFNQRGQLPNRYGFKLDERCIEIPWVYSKIVEAQSIMDAGCAYFKFDSVRRRLDSQTEVTLLTLDERDMKMPFYSNKVTRLEADLRDMPIPDASFDTVVCISTLEHVGMDNTKLYTDDGVFQEYRDADFLKAVRDMARVVRPSGSFFLSVPFGACANHGWLQVFDNSMLDEVTSTLGLTLREETVYQHTTQGWEKSSRNKAREAIYFDVHADKAGVEKSLLAAAESVACLWYQKES